MSTYESGYGEIEIYWEPPDRQLLLGGEGPTASLGVDEPYRETSGHTAWINADNARLLAAELLKFADEADAIRPPTPPH